MSGSELHKVAGRHPRTDTICRAQRVAVCCSALQCVAESGGELQRVAGRPPSIGEIGRAHCVAVCCSALLCVAVRCRVLPCVAVCPREASKYSRNLLSVPINSHNRAL